MLKMLGEIGNICLGYRRTGEPVKTFHYESATVSTDVRTRAIALGRCSVERLIDTPSNHMLLAGGAIVTASSHRCISPTINIRHATGTTQTVPCHSTRASTTTQITTLTLDQSPPTEGVLCVLACFLSTGEFSLFHIQRASAPLRTLTYVPTQRLYDSSRHDAIIHAAFHCPILITLSEGFNLSIYSISHDNIIHTQTLTSFTSYHPASMILTSPSSSSYKLTMAYASAVYPSEWSVGATELLVSRTQNGELEVMSTRTARACDVPSGWIDERKFRSMREQWNRRVGSVANVKTDGKWVVLAPEAQNRNSSIENMVRSNKEEDGQAICSMLSAPALQLYRLSMPSSPSSSNPKLTFVREMFGPSGSFKALSVSDGRCVSLSDGDGNDGEGGIWVWDLETGFGVQVAGSDQFTSIKRSVGSGVLFDDRRIVSDLGSVEVRNFDV